MHPSFPWREQWNEPESGFPVNVRHSGQGRIDSQDCQCYDEYQDIPGRSRHLIASVNAPYSNLELLPEG